jgi:putative oxidoreductase
LVGIGEITLPILLVLGLGTRLAALGILAMTAVIQLVVPDGWVNFHLYWAAIALAIVALGGGAISLDRLIDNLFPQVNRAGYEST